MRALIPLPSQVERFVRSVSYFVILITNIIEIIDWYASSVVSYTNWLQPTIEQIYTQTRSFVLASGRRESEIAAYVDRQCHFNVYCR